MAITEPIYTISRKDKYNFEKDNVYPSNNLLEYLDKAPMIKLKEGGWIALSYEAVNTIFKDKRFLTSNPAFFIPRNMLRNRNPVVKKVAIYPLNFLIKNNKQVKITKSWLNFSNPPDHTRLRKLCQTAFTPRAIKALRPRMEEITFQLLDAIDDKKEFDFIRDFALPLPITMISEILGISHENGGQFKKWSQNILLGFGLNGASKEQREKTSQTIDEIRPFLEEEISNKKDNPGEDVISYFVNANDDNERLTKDEMVSNIVLLLIAGHETTVNLLGNTIHSLLANREQYELLKGDISLLDNTIEESLRFDPPLVSTPRKVSEDMEFMGYSLKKNEPLDLSIFSANRDPEMFENPNTFDITRKNSKSHLSFGQGIHYCLGAPLARTEGEIAFSEIIERYPNLKLSNTHTPQRARSFAFSTFAELIVTK